MFKARLVSGILNIPNEQMNLAGYSPARNFREIHDQLEYNFLLINEDQNKVIIFGSIDCLFLDQTFVNDLKRILGKDYEFCIFASHTHNAPSLSFSTPLLGKVHKDFYKQALHKISSDILKNTNLTEINFIKAGSQETNLNINRRKEALILDYKKLFRTGIFQLKKGIALAPNLDGVIDKTLKAIFFLDKNDSVKVIIWSLAAHAAFFPIFNAISSDFPGFVRERLRKIYGQDIIIIFLPGLAGSAIPNFNSKLIPAFRLKPLISKLLPFKPNLPSFTYKQYKQYSEEISNIIDQIYVSNSQKISSSLVTFTKSKPVELYNTESQRTLMLNVKGVSFDSSVTIIGCNGEMLSEWNSLLCDLSIKNKLMIYSSYMGGDCLYIPPDEEILKGGYEVDGFQKYFSLNGNFVKNLNRPVVAAFKQVLDLLTQRI